jgi:hypothetical protein
MNFYPVLFILSILILIVIIIITIYIRNFFNNSFLNLEIKEKGLLYFYQIQIDSLFRNHDDYKNLRMILLCWIHFIALHLFSPLILASFLLKNDWNVLIAIISIIISMNIFQKIYPARLYSQDQDQNIEEN